MVHPNPHRPQLCTPGAHIVAPTAPLTTLPRGITGGATTPPTLLNPAEEGRRQTSAVIHCKFGCVRHTHPHHNEKGPRRGQGPSSFVAASRGEQFLLLSVHSRLAPRARCAQHCCASKPGGVIQPSGALGAHTLLVRFGVVACKQYLAVIRRKTYPPSALSVVLWIFRVYLINRVSRNWSRPTNDFIVRNLPNNSWISRF
jgi:hypothetical protein